MASNSRNWLQQVGKEFLTSHRLAGKAGEPGWGRTELGGSRAMSSGNSSACHPGDTTVINKLWLLVSLLVFPPEIPNEERVLFELYKSSTLDRESTLLPDLYPRSHTAGDKGIPRVLLSKRKSTDGSPQCVTLHWCRIMFSSASHKKQQPSKRVRNHVFWVQWSQLLSFNLLQELTTLLNWNSLSHLPLDRVPCLPWSN